MVLRCCIAMLAALLVCPLATGAVSPEAQRLIDRAGNTEEESERLRALEELAALPGNVQADAVKLRDFVRRWSTSGLKFYGNEARAAGVKSIADYPFGLAPDSPLMPLAHLYRGRMIAWTVIENSTIRSNPNDAERHINEAKRSFEIAAKAFPRNRIPGMYLGRAIDWPMPLRSPPDAPEWAVLQREQLHRLAAIIQWWVDHQGDSGAWRGGLGDDCEMWRWWAAVLLGFDDERITASQLRFSTMAMRNKEIAATGFSPRISDVEHAAEPTTDNLVPLMMLQPGARRWQDWTMRFLPLMRDVWTGRNARGQVQFKSFYFSDSAVSDAPTRQLDVIANVAAVNPLLLTWLRTRDPKITEVVTPWLDTWVDATARAEGGKPAGVLPASIRWPGGEVSGAEGNWWEPVKPGGFMHSYYVWPSVLTEMTDAMVVAYIVTGNERYLQPLRSMAAIRMKALTQIHDGPITVGGEWWCALQLGPRENANSNFGALVKSLARCKALLGTREFDELIALEGASHALRTDKRGMAELTEALRQSAAAMRVNFPGFTSEVRSTDRCMRFAQFLGDPRRLDDYVGVTLPKHELLYRMVTGDTNAPRFPLMAVRWKTPPTDIAALVTAASTTQLAAQLYHFGDAPRKMAAELRLLAPGRYTAQLVDGGSATALGEVEVRDGMGVVSFELPPGRLCELRVRR